MKRDADIENRHVDTGDRGTRGGGVLRGRGRWDELETRIDIYIYIHTLSCVKEIANGNLCSTRSSQ